MLFDLLSTLFAFVAAYFGASFAIRRDWPMKPYHLPEDDELALREPRHSVFGFVFCLFLAAMAALLTAIFLELI